MKTTHFARILGVPALVCLAQLGCERRSESPKEMPRMPSDRAPQGPLGPSSRHESTATTPAQDSARTAAAVERAPNEAAVSSITNARCDREARCNHVGQGRKFESRTECVTRTRSDWRDDLNAIECPRGVVDTQLTSCLNQIRAESCGNPLDTLERALACRAVDLCKVT
jgi:hypothetical protein